MKMYSLSHAQIRIWYNQKKYMDSSLYNIGGTVKIKGTVDIKILQQSISNFVRDNATIRLQFCEQDQQVLQYVSDKILPIDFVDFSHEPNPAKAYERWVHTHSHTAFKMDNSPLYYFTVFQLDRETMGYFVKIHHILADGWSMKLLTEQVKNNYESYHSGPKFHPLVTDSPYLHYVHAEQEYLHTDSAQAAKKHWNGHCNDSAFISSPPSFGLSGCRRTFPVESSFQKRLESFIKCHGITLNTFFVGIYLIYAYKQSGEKSGIIGTPLLGRSSKAERSIFGTFTNTMPFCYTMTPNRSSIELFRDISNKLKRNYKYQKLPFDILKEEQNLSENGIALPFACCINYYNTVLSQTIAGKSIENIEFYNGAQAYPMQLILRHWEEQKLQIDIDYQTDAYSEPQILNLYEQLMRLSNQVITNPTLCVCDLSLASEAECRHFLHQLNRTEKRYPLHQTWLDLFSEMVEKNPGQISVSHKNRSLTYHTLDQKTNGAANYLRSIGLKKGMLAAITPNYTIESIIFILAILKCGAVYLPIDRSTPIQRIQNILKHSNAGLFLSDLAIPGYTGLSVHPSQIDLTEKTATFSPPSPDDIAYIIHTSGTKGTPKGVMVKHRNLMNYLCWAKENYNSGSKEVFPLYSSFAFDFTITSLFLPLVSGGEIRVYHPFQEKNVLEEILHENKSTILKITPSHIPLLCDCTVDSSSIHTIILGGEDLKSAACKQLAEKFHNRIKIYNEYGPTETTVGCMIYQYNNDPGLSVPIGRPIANTQVYLLDKDMHPVPYDTPGELYIGGEGVSAGYYNMPSETQKVYLPNPFRPGQSLYKTGDIAVRDRTDNLTFLGRNDDECKIRGYRVNLFEIENTILSSGMVQKAVVKKVESEANALLAAYICTDKGFDLKKFRQYLYQNLPLYLVPQSINLLQEFPLNKNGKVDKAKLPPPANNQPQHLDAHQSAEETILLSVMQGVLKKEAISACDDFYAIGGDSIKAIQLVSRLSEQGYEITIKDILTNPIMEDMALCLRRKTQNPYDQSVCSGTIEKSSMMQWFFQQSNRQTSHFNQSILLRLNMPVSRQFLEDVFSCLVCHHDALRINYNWENEQLFYNKEHLHNKIRVMEINREEESLCPSDQFLAEHTRQAFDLEKDLLLRVYSITNKSGHYLYLIAHHIIIDSVSWQILLNDLALAFQQGESPLQYTLPPKTMSYQTYIKLCSKQSDGFKSAQETAAAEPSDIPDKKMCATCNQSRFLHIDFGRDTTAALLHDACVPYHSKPHELIATALCLTLKDLVGLDVFDFELESHGRDLVANADVSRTVGWFTALYPVQIAMTHITGFADKIKTIKEQFRNADKHIQTSGETGKRRFPERQIRFNYLSEYIEPENDFFTLQRVCFPHDISPETFSPAFLEVTMLVLHGKLELYLRYRADLLPSPSVAKFEQTLKQSVLSLIRHCTLQHSAFYTPSDFELLDISQKELDDLLSRKEEES